VKRLRIEGSWGIALAQVLLKTAGPISFAHVPRGPVIKGDIEAALSELVPVIDDVCRRHRAVSLIVELDKPLSLEEAPRRSWFIDGPPHLHPARTVRVRLQDDANLLAGMHATTRYHVRRAKRHGVLVEQAGDDDATRAALYELLADTSRRNGFPIHSRTYYDDIFRLFGDDAVLMMARIDDTLAAGCLVVQFGDEAIYLHGGSSTEHRSQGAAHYLQFEAMRWARERGCQSYDLWGIATPGLFQFKTGFGGEVLDYPPTLERRYRPILAAITRTAVAARYPIRSWFGQRLARGHG
jgi:hypothetical protein